MKNVIKYSIAIIMIALVHGDPVGVGDWTSVRLYGHAYKNSDYTTQQYNFIKNNYHIHTIEKRHAYQVYGSPSTQLSSRNTADTLHKNNPSCKPLFYWNAELAFTSIYESLEGLPSNYFVDNGYTQKSYNFSDPKVRTLWRTVPRQAYNWSNIKGVFVDAMPKAAAQGNLDILHSMMDTLPGLVIYNGYRVSPRGDMQAGAETLEHADGVFVEFFFSYLMEEVEHARFLMEELLSIPSNKYIICRGTPNGYGANGSHKFSLACYLIVANNRSFYIYNDDYEADNALYWHADFGRRLGEPLHDAQRVNANVYTRTFEHAHVYVNLNTRNSKITWK